MPTVLKSGNLNLLEPSGPVQACNGIALLLPFYFATLCSFGETDTSFFREEESAVACVRAVLEDMLARRGLYFLSPSVGPPLIIDARL